jgi:hypothetical protein
MTTLHALAADKLERADPTACAARRRIPLDNIHRWLAHGRTTPHRLAPWRLKDLDLRRALLKLGILEPAPRRAHCQQTPLGEKEAATAGRDLTLLLGEISAP